MKGYVEKMIRDYPEMVRRRDMAKKQIEALQKTEISDIDIIESLTFGHPDGERVQTSNISDKTATIAFSYQDRRNRLNDEVFSYWMKQYDTLCQEISFLEKSIGRLSGDQKDVMQALVLDSKTWESVECECAMSRTTVHRIRKEAVDSLVRDYQKRESKELFLLLQ